MSSAEEGRVVCTKAAMRGDLSIRRASQGATFSSSLNESKVANAETGATSVDFQLDARF